MMTHLVQLLPRDFFDRGVRVPEHQVEVYDTLTFDFLPYFPAILDFIDKALKTTSKTPRVVLFCQAGISRSGTIAILYLMRKHNWSYHEAKTHLVEKQGTKVAPNRNFERQILFFQAMGFQLKEDHPVYRAWQKLSLLQTEAPHDRWQAASTFVDDHFKTMESTPKDMEGLLEVLPTISSMSTEEISAASNKTETPKMLRLKCRRCRTLVAKQEQLDPSHDARTCQAYYLSEYPSWLNERTLALSKKRRKLQCPACDVKLGPFTWSGTKCACGRWVAPCLQLTASKVDPVLQIVRPEEEDSDETSEEEEEEEVVEEEAVGADQAEK